MRDERVDPRPDGRPACADRPSGTAPARSVLLGYQDGWPSMFNRITYFGAPKEQPMRFTTPLILLGSMTSTFAQVTFNQAQLTPTMGAQPTMYMVDHVEPGPATNGFVFNVGPITLGAATTPQYMLPSATPYASSFPQATHASTGLVDPTNYSFMRVDATGLYMLGMASPEISMAYSNTEKIFSIPLGLNTTWSDTWAVTSEASGVEVVRTGTTTGAYNGHGTLVLPWGSYPVARVQLDQTYGDNMMGIDMVSYQSHVTSYVALVDGSALTLFSSTEFIITYTGGEPITTYSSMVTDPAASGVDEADLGTDATFFPNPATDEATVRLGASHQGLMHWSVLDMTGRVLRTETLVANGLSTDVLLQLQDLAAGRYLLRLTNAEGTVRSLPFNVQ